ncbi:hypothetical protein NLJ89_g6253 [Agrocybe chaxingu]|uniref:Magnesium-dependent phosphatase 1 n=1 Tax=Agrocybe chaxingu TaxID=84603 RepID=A0A9W8MSV8_9AGAR|nr:hypothetical protein NLJ89_g6253 [Agrocybe chaxingu]
MLQARPLKRPGDAINKVVDKYGEPISFYRDVAGILHGLRGGPLLAEGDNEDRKVVVAVCSRTHAPDLARQCLRLLLVPPKEDGTSQSEPRPAVEYFDEFEIYPSSKLKHFRALHDRTGIPYTEMLFFDDEHRNSEVEKLGVTFMHVPQGLTHKAYEDGLKEWRRRRVNDQ